VGTARFSAHLQGEDSRRARRPVLPAAAAAMLGHLRRSLCAFHRLPATGQGHAACNPIPLHRWVCPVPYHYSIIPAFSPSFSSPFLSPSKSVLLITYLDVVAVSNRQFTFNWQKTVAWCRAALCFCLPLLSHYDMPSILYLIPPDVVKCWMELSMRQY